MIQPVNQTCVRSTSTRADQRFRGCGRGRARRHREDGETRGAIGQGELKRGGLSRPRCQCQIQSDAGPGAGRGGTQRQRIALRINRSGHQDQNARKQAVTRAGSQSCAEQISQVRRLLTSYPDVGLALSNRLGLGQILGWTPGGVQGSLWFPESPFTKV